jgi:hypothetical protein
MNECSNNCSLNVLSIDFDVRPRDQHGLDMRIFHSEDRCLGKRYCAIPGCSPDKSYPHMNNAASIWRGVAAHRFGASPISPDAVRIVHRFLRPLMRRLGYCECTDRSTDELVRTAQCTERHVRKVPFKLLAAQCETDALPHIFILVLTGNSPFSGMGASRDIAVYNFGRNQTANGGGDNY